MARTDVTAVTPTNELTEPAWTNVAAGVGNGARIKNYNKDMLLLIRNPHASNPTGNINLVPSGSPPGAMSFAVENVVIAAGDIYYAKGMSPVLFEDSNGDLLIDVAGTQAVDILAINT